MTMQNTHSTTEWGYVSYIMLLIISRYHTSVKWEYSPFSNKEQSYTADCMPIVPNIKYSKYRITATLKNKIYQSAV